MVHSVNLITMTCSVISETEQLTMSMDHHRIRRFSFKLFLADNEVTMRKRMVKNHFDFIAFLATEAIIKMTYYCGVIMNVVQCKC